MISFVVKVKKPFDSGERGTPLYSCIGMWGTEGYDLLADFWFKKTELIFSILLWNSQAMFLHNSLELSMLFIYKAINRYSLKSGNYKPFSKGSLCLWQAWMY